MAALLGVKLRWCGICKAEQTVSTVSNSCWPSQTEAAALKFQSPGPASPLPDATTLHRRRCCTLTNMFAKVKMGLTRPRVMKSDTVPLNSEISVPTAPSSEPGFLQGLDCSPRGTAGSPRPGQLADNCLSFKLQRESTLGAAVRFWSSDAAAP